MFRNASKKSLSLYHKYGIVHLSFLSLCPFFVSAVFLWIRKSISPPRTTVSSLSASSPLTTVGHSDGAAPLPKHGQFMLRPPHPTPASELYYQESHSAYDPAHYQPNCESWFQGKINLNMVRLEILNHVFFLFFLFLSSRFLLSIHSPSFSQTLHGSLPQIRQRPRILFATFCWPSVNFLPQ